MPSQGTCNFYGVRFDQQISKDIGAALTGILELPEGKVKEAAYHVVGTLPEVPKDEGWAAGVRVLIDDLKSSDSQKSATSTEQSIGAIRILNCHRNTDAAKPDQ